MFAKNCEPCTIYVMILVKFLLPTNVVYALLNTSTLKRIPSSIATLFELPHISFVGVGIKHCVDPLERDHGIGCRKAVDLGQLVSINKEKPKLSALRLGNLAYKACVYDVGMTAPGCLFRDSGVDKLSSEQIKFATVDAFMTLYAEMSRLRGAMSLKRKRSGPEDPSNQLTNDERAVFNLIRSKGDMGIWKGDMKRELRSINARVVDNCIKSLQAKRVIKEVVNIQSKGKNRLMSMEFEPSKELTGGAWYNEGNLDMEFITYLKKLCLGGIRKLKVATADGIQIHDMIKKSGAFKVDVSIQQIQDILKNLVLENEIFEVKSTGSGEFAHVPVGTACYKSTGRGQLGGSGMGAMALIPCGVCPRINQCTDDGVISPTTCVYYTKWSEF